VSGVFEAGICLVLKEREEVVRDPMECSTLETAVEKMIEGRGRVWTIAYVIMQS